MRIAWIEMWSGLSGDMFVGALLDAGWTEDRLRSGIESLGLGPYSLRVERRDHRGLTGLGIHVDAPADVAHRHYADIVRHIDNAPLPVTVQARAREVFRLLGEAEARIHGVPLERVHFHEIGAYDSIVDIVGTVLGVHELGLDRVYAGAVPIGSGEIEIGHGRVPVPAPATALLLEGWPVRPTATRGEFFTPTAAALLRVLGEPSETIPAMRVTRVGYGAGTRAHPQLPNLVRLWIGESQDESAPGEAEFGLVSVLETQIDDMDPRFLSALSDRLFDSGALDVMRMSVAMKKGRLGTLVIVIARPGDATRLAGVILAESSTLGVRLRQELRWELPRRLEEVSTSLGMVRVKWPNAAGRRLPSVEYEDILRIARQTGRSLEEIQAQVLRELPMRD